MASRSTSYLASSPEASVTLSFGESNAVTFVSRLENISVLDESPWDLTIISTAEQLIGWMRHEFLISPNLTNARESFFGIDGCRWLAELLSRSIALPFGAAPVTTGIDDFAHAAIITTRHSNNESVSLESTQLCNMDSSSTSSKIAPKLLYCLVKNGFLTYSCGGSAPDESVMMERSSIFSFDLPSNLMNVAYVHLIPSRSASEVSQLLLEMAMNCPFAQMPQPQHDVALRMDHLSCELQRIRLEGMNSKDLLCFYINIYNFMVVHAKLKGKLPVFFGTTSHNRDRIAAFQTISYLIGNKIHNLFNIECSLLGRSLRDSVNTSSQFNSWDTTSVKSKSIHSTISPEPRLLFLLCKGSVSCPKIRIVTADILPLALKTAMKEYIADHRTLPTTHSKLKSFFQGYRNSLWLPRIFKWHAGDFGLCAYDTIMFYLDQLEEYESRDFRSTIKTTTCSTRIEFHLYDWTDRKTSWFAPQLAHTTLVESVPTPPMPITSPAFQRHAMASPRFHSSASPRLASFSPIQTHSPRLTPYSPRTPAVIAAMPISPPPAPDRATAGVPLTARKFVSSAKKLPGPPSSVQLAASQSSDWDSNEQQLAMAFQPLDSDQASKQTMNQSGGMAELDARFQIESTNIDSLESLSLSMGQMNAGSVIGSEYSQPNAAYDSYGESAQFQYDGDSIEEEDEYSESEDDVFSQASWFPDDVTVTSQSTMPLDRQKANGLQALNYSSSLTTASHKLASLSAANAFRLANSNSKNQTVALFSEAQAESF
jgi:hypothetical protein